MIAAPAVAATAPLRSNSPVSDLVLLFPSKSFLGILLNRGDGTYATPTTIRTPAGSGYVTAVATGDITGDGKPDLVLTSTDNNTVIVLPGNGDGTFGAAVTYSLGATNVSPGSIAVADLNGDGKMDVVTGNLGSVSVLLNNGSGGLLPATTYSTGIIADCTLGCGATLAVNNLNADNKPDIVTATTLANTSQIAVLLNQGNGTFGTATTYAVGGGPLSIATGDLNGDHRTDITVANNFDSTVSVLLNNGSGVFAPQVTYPVGNSPVVVAIDDSTLDGKPDLFVVGNFGTLTVLPGNGDGTFPRIAYPVGTDPRDVLAVDLTGDNKPDLVTVNHNDGIAGSLSVLLNNGSGGFAPASGSPVSISDSIFAVAAADFTGDTKTDLAVAGFNITMLTGSGTGGFTVGSPILSLFGYFIAIVAADLGNGHPDLVVADQAANAVDVLIGDGHGNFTAATGSPIAIGATPNAIAVAYVNDDTKPDLVVSRADGKVSVFLGDGAGHFIAASGSPITVNTTAGSIAVMDVNGDQKADLIVVHGTSTSYDSVSVLLGTGTGAFGAPTALPADPNIAPSRFGTLAVMDLNGDGNVDIAVTNKCSGGACPYVSLYAGIGDGTFVAARIYEVGQAAKAKAIRAADVNGDGRTDLVVAGSTPFGTGVVGPMRNGTIPASAATHLVFATSVLNPLSANTLFAASVLAEDASGNIVTGFGGPITLSLNGGSGLGGTLTQNALGGGALYTGLTIANWTQPYE